MNNCKFKHNDKGQELEEQKPDRSTRQFARWSTWTLGLGSLVWLILRSGTKPRRLAYPCQQTALMSSLGFVGYLLSLMGSTYFYHRLKHRVTVPKIILFALAVVVTSGIASGVAVQTQQILASPTLPAWTSPSAVSDVFAVTEVPVPECSLDGGELPGSGSCSNEEYALHDDGVDSLITLMENQGTHFYKTSAHPNGIVAANDVVVIKVNNQNIDFINRYSTNTDVLKGLIWRILQRPDGTIFAGEIVVAENRQRPTAEWDANPANAEDQNQSFQDVVDVFQGLGYPVSLKYWGDLPLISGGSINNSGYPTGEYAQGNTSDAYIMLEDPDGPGTEELSYPKFQTDNGNYVSMRYGVWNGINYDEDRLTFINLPVLKAHGSAGATSSWKNLIGFITVENADSRFGSVTVMHPNFFLGGYGLIGRQIALVRKPDLNVVDAIWVAYQSNYQGLAVRQDVLLSSTDPFAVDWYASEYVLASYTGWNRQSAARYNGDNGMRATTLVNQNSAEAVWPGSNGPYPYIDLIDSYEGTTPSPDEISQMNVYVNENSTAPVANDDFDTTGEDTAVTVDVCVNDIVSYGRSLDPSSVGVTTSPSNGSANENPIGGTITYTPNPGLKGVDSFVYQVCDNEAECDTATVTIIVAPYQTYLPIVLKH